VGETTFILRIILQPTTANVPFKFSRLQFPLKLVFTITINKSQGQSIKNVGVDLRTSVFFHNQLYVVLSRSTSIYLLKVFLSKHIPKTMNIVYSKVLI